MTEQHADFEALSAYVDGEAPEWADHVEGCAGCRATAAQVRALSNEVSLPVGSPSDAERDAAIAAAVESFQASDGAAELPTVAVAAAGPGRPRLAPERPASGRPRTSRPWAMPAVAAVIVGVLGFSGLVLSSYRSSDDETTTLAGPGLQSDKAESAVAANAPPVPVGDLGDVPDAATLRARALPGAPAASSARSSDASATPGSATATAGAGGAAAPQGNVTNSGSTGASGSATATGGTVQVQPPTTTLNQRAIAPRAAGTRPCEERARTRDPRLGEVVYFASARQGQEAAVVLGFATGPAPAPVTLLLLAQDDCAELLRSTGP